jgi:hypothetical protein
VVEVPPHPPTHPASSRRAVEPVNLVSVPTSAFVLGRWSSRRAPPPRASPPHAASLYASALALPCEPAARGGLIAVLLPARTAPARCMRPPAHAPPASSDARRICRHREVVALRAARTAAAFACAARESCCASPVQAFSLRLQDAHAHCRAISSVLPPGRSTSLQTVGRLQAPPTPPRAVGRVTCCDCRAPPRVGYCACTFTDAQPLPPAMGALSGT